MKDVILTPTQSLYDIQADTSIPASVRGREVMQNFKQAVRYAKELGGV